VSGNAARAAKRRKQYAAQVVRDATEAICRAVGIMLRPPYVITEAQRNQLESLVDRANGVRP